ncbi:manganese-dependent inorganic pyrophosphatase [Flammeovirga kamogawensis]|uniref:inorganic diphosphatase n=1 Tax=Flammeovirga kamogawensis TaxID=373891 RepID=A0ABX8H4F4_9BACT|nr:manganese-dependent inorganic pyrophosphatase [Flammeovirga kamogawensis]MBB6460228.1 manganese-dependent inorganic pyrophosphatase [Flammeovirga kamogawensis]QWG10040.1 manganese-dependent inorganic pyrophosphatase [Flammeovirga kamogawensis]TRX65547.1 manganese-dependent inorganic pyrophosphatase [Flammeovirga kamogawensis]
MSFQLSFPSNALFVGHKNPDTDCTCTAIAAANLWGGTPIIQGELNPETEFVLAQFKVEKPAFEDDFAGKDVVIVDHNQTTQSAASVVEANILSIIDHHAVQDNFFFQKGPIHIDMRTVASCCTIIADYYKEMNVEISEQMAGVMLGGILSDTLGLTVPHTTDIDREIAAQLAEIAGIDSVEGFANEMLAAKSDLSKYTAAEILNLDYKDFIFGDIKIGFGVCESLLIDKVIAKQEEINAAMIENKKGGYDAIFFAYVDLVTKNSVVVGADDADFAVLEKAFGLTKGDLGITLEGKISRKNDFIPPVSAHYTA